jgi:hypothetical protein
MGTVKQNSPLKTQPQCRLHFSQKIPFAVNLNVGIFLSFFVYKVLAGIKNGLVLQDQTGFYRTRGSRQLFFFLNHSKEFIISQSCPHLKNFILIGGLKSLKFSFKGVSAVCNPLKNL